VWVDHRGQETKQGNEAKEVKEKRHLVQHEGELWGRASRHIRGNSEHKGEASQAESSNNKWEREQQGFENDRAAGEGREGTLPRETERSGGQYSRGSWSRKRWA